MQPDGAKLFLKYAVAGTTVRRALRIALVVGPALTLINHAHNIVALNLGPRFVLQTVLTFCVPYMVSTYSTAMTELANARGAAAPMPAAGESGAAEPGR